jgi:hypothetical protein
VRRASLVRGIGIGVVAFVAVVATLVVGAANGLTFWRGERVPSPVKAAGGLDASVEAIPLAVLGDSNSHSYQDGIAFPPGSGQRGGDFHAATFQWTEVLARLRGNEIDQGPWTASGHSRWVAMAGRATGMQTSRVPRKEDYLYNFAVSGAVCSNLIEGSQRQALRLVESMNEDPALWKRGVVVIRIGLNDWTGLMDLQARTPDAPETQATIARCAGHMDTAMRLIHDAHPETRIVLVGVADESADPGTFDRWQSKSETQNIVAALRRFNDVLEKLAQGEPNTLFFDDDEWVRRHWGSRDANGKPAYKTVSIGTRLRVTNTTGDAPQNAVLADHHSGLVYNALWAQSLVMRLRESFGLPLTPIGDEELARFVEAVTASKPER